jgi:hypothetical protein
LVSSPVCQEVMDEQALNVSCWEMVAEAASSLSASDQASNAVCEGEGPGVFMWNHRLQRHAHPRMASVAVSLNFKLT